MQQNGAPPKGTITGKAEIKIDAAIQTVFNFITTESSLPKILKSYGPVHGVAKAQLHRGNWRAAGDYRTLYFTNGDTLKEEMLVFDPPAYFCYSISEFSNFARHLTTIAYGQWQFQMEENTTHVLWTYSFQPKRILTRLPLFLFIHFYFKKYMQQCLALAKQSIEENSR